MTPSSKSSLGGRHKFYGSVLIMFAAGSVWFGKGLVATFGPWFVPNCKTFALIRFCTFRSNTGSSQCHAPLPQHGIHNERQGCIMAGMAASFLGHISEPLSDFGARFDRAPYRSQGQDQNVVLVDLYLDCRVHYQLFDWQFGGPVEGSLVVGLMGLQGMGYNWWHRLVVEIL